MIFLCGRLMLRNGCWEKVKEEIEEFRSMELIHAMPCRALLNEDVVLRSVLNGGRRDWN
jgi:hypothetical protein